MIWRIIFIITPHLIINIFPKNGYRKDILKINEQPWIIQKEQYIMCLNFPGLLLFFVYFLLLYCFVLLLCTATPKLAAVVASSSHPNMSLSFVKFLFPNREEEDNPEWILTVSEVKRWRAVVSKESRDGQSLQQLKRYLRERKFTIGANTFASGFIQVLHQACKSRAFTLVEYLLENHVKHFDVNELVLHHPEPARYFQSGCSISISDKAAHVKDTLVHAAASRDSILILKLLISHGASVNIPDCCSRVPIMTSIEQRKKMQSDF